MIDVSDTGIPKVKLITPRRFGDSRGWFSETWTKPKMAAAGLDLDFMQDNHSYSAQTHTLRGLHYQAPLTASRYQSISLRFSNNKTANPVGAKRAAWVIV